MILLFAGTTEGRKAANILKEKNLDFIVSVTTEDGALAFKDQNIRVLCGNLDACQIEKTIEEYKIRYIVDATHPFATQISKNIIDVGKTNKINVIKIIREPFNLPKNSLIKEVPYIKKAAELACSLGNTIFLTTGSKNIHKFTAALPENQKDNMNLIARVLPTKSSIQRCLEAEIQSQNIITGIGPFSIEENIKDFKKYSADVVVSKDSGKFGGLREKVQAALDLSVYIIIIKCPPDPYKNCGLRKLKLTNLSDFKKISLLESARN